MQLNALNRTFSLCPCISLSLDKMTNCLWNAVCDVYSVIIDFSKATFLAERTNWSIPFISNILYRNLNLNDEIENWQKKKNTRIQNSQITHEKNITKIFWASNAIHWMKGKKKEELCEENKNKNWIEWKRKKTEFFAWQLQCDRKRQLYEVILCMKHSVVSWMHTMGRQSVDNSLIEWIILFSRQFSVFYNEFLFFFVSLLVIFWQFENTIFFSTFFEHFSIQMLYSRI